MAALDRLNAVFPKYAQGELGRMVDGYRAALNDMDAEKLEGAVTLALKHEMRFPVPAKLRELGEQWARHTRAPLLPVPVPPIDDNSSVVCRRCNSRPRLAVLQGTHYKTGEPFEYTKYVALCDETRHQMGDHVVLTPANFLRWSA